MRQVKNGFNQFSTKSAAGAIALALIFSLSACSKNQDSQVTAAGESNVDALVSEKLVEISAPLNQTDQYKLTPEDVALLQNQGLLKPGDQQVLTTLTAK